MKTLNTIVISAISLVLFTGCNDEAPNCSDSLTTDLVIEIANEEIVKSIGQSNAEKIKLSVESIRTTDKNEKVGSFECAADLKVEGPNGSNSAPITYTSELADGGDNFYVQVYGL